MKLDRFYIYTEYVSLQTTSLQTTCVRMDVCTYIGVYVCTSVDRRITEGRVQRLAGGYRPSRARETSTRRGWKLLGSLWRDEYASLQTNTLHPWQPAMQLLNSLGTSRVELPKSPWPDEPSPSTVRTQCTGSPLSLILDQYIPTQPRMVGIVRTRIRTRRTTAILKILIVTIKFSKRLQLLA